MHPGLRKHDPYTVLDLNPLLTETEYAIIPRIYFRYKVTKPLRIRLSGFAKSTIMNLPSFLRILCISEIASTNENASRNEYPHKTASTEDSLNGIYSNTPQQRLSF